MAEGIKDELQKTEVLVLIKSGAKTEDVLSSCDPVLEKDNYVVIVMGGSPSPASTSNPAPHAQASLISDLSGMRDILDLCRSINFTKLMPILKNSCQTIMDKIMVLLNAAMLLKRVNSKMAMKAGANIKAHLSEYCRHTSIHGLRYLGEERRPLLERALWLAAFILSLLACLYLIRNAWIKWHQTPVIVSLDETLRPLWQLPFPAVTICPETKARANVFNFTEMYHQEKNGTISDENLEIFSTVSLVCDPHLFQSGNLTTDYTTIERLEDLAPVFVETVWVSQWHGQTINASLLFRPIMTEEGICYSFNMLDGADFFPNNTNRISMDWSLDVGYSPTAGVETYPNRAMGAGAYAGLSVVLALKNDELDFMCKGPVQGFKIQLHSPADFPRVGQQYFRVPMNQEVVVAVAPDVITTSPELIRYKPLGRQCYFPSERRLRFFNVYTQQNCALECLTNHTLTVCGCVAFYMPRELDTPICGSGNTQCVKNATEQLLVQEVYEGLRTTDSGPNCHCLQSCTALQYKAERSQADFDWQRMLTAFDTDPTPFQEISMARVYIFFKDTQFIGSRRSELYGDTDFLANCGGLLGLGLGISVLSLVELLYWLALRVFRPDRPTQDSQ
ncbi:pickpocket protein 28-like [Anabrus simplex]|uniref:pickpocket protein 28-like n=1 Tax=Anabrus simplex TaxID=316456 RepID=UPI0035A2B9DA